MRTCGACTLCSHVSRKAWSHCERYESHVRRAGLSAISELVGEGGANIDALEPKAYVHALSEIHHKNSGIVTRSFVGEAGFVASLDKACREFINRNAVTGTLSTRSSELIAMYADMLLRKDIKMAEDDLEGALNCVVCSSKLISFSLSLTIGSQMVLFKYLEDKDMFRTFYTTKLSKHLVHGSWCVHIRRWGREHDFQVEGGL